MTNDQHPDAVPPTRGAPGDAVSGQPPREAPRWGEFAPPGYVPPVAPPEALTPPPAAPPAPRRRTWDLVLTVALLAIGAFSVISNLVPFAGLSGLLDMVYEQAGYGDYVSTQLADTIGLVLNVVNVGLLVLALWLSIRSLRAGRIAFYWPLSAGILSVIAVAVGLLVAMFGDPGLAEFVQEG